MKNPEEVYGAHLQAIEMTEGRLKQWPLPVGGVRFGARAPFWKLIQASQWRKDDLPREPRVMKMEKDAWTETKTTFLDQA